MRWGLVADWTGLEPATSAVTGRHSNRLNYQSLPFFKSDAKVRAFESEHQIFLKKIFIKFQKSQFWPTAHIYVLFCVKEKNFAK